MRNIFPAKSINPAFRKCKFLKELIQSSRQQKTKTTITTSSCGLSQVNAKKPPWPLHVLIILSSVQVRVIDMLLKITYHTCVTVVTMLSTMPLIVYFAIRRIHCYTLKGSPLESSDLIIWSRYLISLSDLINNKGRWCELEMHFNSKQHCLSDIRFTIIERVRNIFHV